MSKPLSIITAVHNSLAMNRLYWEMLVANTTTHFQLVVIDNHSTDGSEEFFLKLSQRARGPKVTYVRNEKNQSYPASQNQGMQHAQHPILCFLNNDIWLEKGWNENFVTELDANRYQVLSPSGQEAQPTQALSDALKKRWKRTIALSKVWKTLFLKSEEERLWWCLTFMYGKLDPFVSPTPRVPSFNGIKGDAVVFHQDLLSILPDPWDERIEASDWHLYLTVAKLHEASKYIPLPKVLTSVYCHHFGRYSAKQKFEPLDVKFLKLEEVWKEADIRRLWWGYQLPKEV